MPMIAVDLLDVYGNPITCGDGLDDIEKSFIYSEVDACQDPDFSSSGRFKVHLSLLAGCHTPDTCDGTNLTDISFYEDRQGETTKGRVKFQNLRIETSGFNYQLLARVTLHNGTVLSRQSDKFKVLTIVYDFLEVKDVHPKPLQMGS